MQPARAATVLGRFDGERLTERGVTTTFFKRGDAFVVNTEGADGQAHDYEVRYTFGVAPLQQYLVELTGGRIQPLPVAWDSRPASSGGQRWFRLTPGQRIAHTDELHWTGRQQNWNYMCADCHSTGVRKGYDAAADRFKTEWTEINVSCEACHGPGSRHTSWAKSPAWLRRFTWADNGLTAALSERRGASWIRDSITGNAHRSTPRPSDQEVATCAQCHSRRVQIAEGHIPGAPLLDSYVPSLLVPGLYHADGQQRDEVYNYGSFMQSRMYHAGVTCADCHDPHTQQLRQPGNQLCAQCHSAAKYDVPAHHHHAAASAGASCVACHMPATTYMQIDPRADHSIRVPRPDRTVTLGVPNACATCHANRDAAWAAANVRAWTPKPVAGYQRFAEAFAADERNAEGAADSLSSVAADSTEPTFVRASALARLANRPSRIAFQASAAWVRDTNALVRRAALEILEALPPAQRLSVAPPLLRDTSRAVRIEAAWVLAPVIASLTSPDARAAFDRASGEFIASQRLHADRPENRTTLGTFFAQIGRPADAIAEYRAALRLAPGFAGAYVDLADVLRAAGQEPEAERTLRAGLATLPSDASLHHALGLSLARSGRASDALAELQRAASLAPADANFAYAYALGLNGAGRSREALRVLEAALASNADDRAILLALATIHRDLGERDAALRYAQRLIKRDSTDAEALALARSLK